MRFPVCVRAEELLGNETLISQSHLFLSSFLKEAHYSLELTKSLQVLKRLGVSCLACRKHTCTRYWLCRYSLRIYIGYIFVRLSALAIHCKARAMLGVWVERLLISAPMLSGYRGHTPCVSRSSREAESRLFSPNGQWWRMFHHSLHVTNISISTVTLFHFCMVRCQLKIQLFNLKLNVFSNVFYPPTFTHWIKNTLIRYLPSNIILI